MYCRIVEGRRRLPETNDTGQVVDDSGILLKRLLRGRGTNVGYRVTVPKERLTDEKSIGQSEIRGANWDA